MLSTDQRVCEMKHQEDPRDRIIKMNVRGRVLFAPPAPPAVAVLFLNNIIPSIRLIAEGGKILGIYLPAQRVKGR